MSSIFLDPCFLNTSLYLRYTTVSFEIFKYFPRLECEWTQRQIFKVSFWRYNILPIYFTLTDTYITFFYRKLSRPVEQYESFLLCFKAK